MDSFDLILGESEAVQALRAFGRRAAAVDAPVLLTGETGTGKGLLARAIHEESLRRRAPFVQINCAGVAATLFESEFFGHARGAFTGAQYAHRGLLEQANSGTLFLDEVVELAPSLQAKLLTALEDGVVRRVGAERTVTVDVRLIAACGTGLHAAVQRGRFRRDLYHRLLVLSYHMPPLRDRAADIELLARTFLEHYARRYARPIAGFSAAASARMLAHPWPGNVRELDHAVQAAVLACDGARIEPAHLGALAPPGLRDVQRARVAGRYRSDGDAAAEADRIRAALLQCRGNKTRAARMLGMARNTLHLKLRGLHAHAPDDGAH